MADFLSQQTPRGLEPWFLSTVLVLGKLPIQNLQNLYNWCDFSKVEAFIEVLLSSNKKPHENEQQKICDFLVFFSWFQQNISTFNKQLICIKGLNWLGR